MLRETQPAAPQCRRSRDTPPPRRYPKYKILNFDRLDYCSCLANLEEVAALPNYKFVKGDICSADLVNYVLETEKIDTIMHFAAQTHVDNSFGNSFQFTRNNILGTHVLLEAAKVHDVVRFVHVSTDEVYGEGESMETAPMIEEIPERATARIQRNWPLMKWFRGFCRLIGG